MSKERYSPEQIHLARQADLAEYLMSVGVPLIKEGNRYRYKDDTKLVFTKNSFFWNGRNETGNAIDFLIKYLGEIGERNLSFRDAMTELVAMTSFSQPDKPKSLEIPAFTFEGVTLSENHNRIIAYLCKTRKIDYSIVKNLINKQLLFQEVATYPDKRTGQPREMYNALFPIYDERGQIVGAETVGTLTTKRFKGIKEGSTYGYGYTVIQGEVTRYALFFESAIDLLSFMDVVKLKNKSLDSCILVSLAGLKENIFEQTMHKLDESITPILCVDNDAAGENFIKQALAKCDNIKIFRPEKQFKDWNEQFCEVKKS